MPDDLAALEQAVAALPENLPLRRQLAEALSRAGRHGDALAHYRQILAGAPADAAALLGCARGLFDDGQYADALAHYDRAVALDVRLADAELRDRLGRAEHDPRARIRLVASGDPTPVVATPETRDKPVTFADVGGLDELKERIRLRILHPLKRPDVYKAFGKRTGGGLLFYGPPGCGKTFLARATAGEAGLRFIAVGIDEILDMWLGQSEKKLHELFRSARAQTPTVLFFDEVDALGGKRSGVRHESYRTLVTQFLSELDGANGQNEGVLVLGATNAPWDVDPAFRRPGRFGEVLFVPPPDLRARVEILKLKLAGRPVAEMDFTAIARRTDLYSGADLEHLVEIGTEAALYESLRGGAVRPIVTADVTAALSRVRATTLEWFSAAKSFATYANEGGQYDELAKYISTLRL